METPNVVHLLLSLPSQAEDSEQGVPVERVSLSLSYEEEFDAQFDASAF